MASKEITAILKELERKMGGTIIHFHSDSIDERIKDDGKKCYVLMISRTFPKVHPKAEEETVFIESIENGSKIHTIRGNYEKWLNIAEEVNNGEAYISLRHWSKSPYNNKRDGSKQVEFKRLYEIGIQHIRLERNTAFVRIDDSNNQAFSVVANNDGLSTSNMYHWFFAQKKEHVINGAIIHFTDFRY